jgi:uncharacterized protein with PIN domain/sulfur carrier protein ThiS
MGDAILRFYEELNDFLAPTQRKREFVHAFRQRTSVKDMIESLGVPHTEVDVILVNGESVGFDRIIEDGDRIAVYPVFESFDVTPIVRLRERPLRDVRFIVDAQLGVLARYLRLCGFDTVYRNDWRDEDLVRLAVTERRVILTRDRALLKRSIVTHGYFVRADKPRAQLKEVCERLDLWNAIVPYRRCIRCNGLLEVVDKAAVVDVLEPDTRRCHNEFTRCGNCRRVYWRGSHVRRMETLLADLRQCSTK